MPNKHKTPGINWHSEDPTLKPWITDEAKRRGWTVRELLDHVLSRFRRESSGGGEATTEQEN